MSGIALNEDDSHYYSTRAGRRLDRATVASWVDQYAGTQVRELFLNPNCMRTSYDSAVWDPIWRGYDPEADANQPLFASLSPEERRGVRGWVHTAWQLAHDGIDVYAEWIARCRQHGIAPWISMRMNDVHWVNDEQCFIHSEFWREHPELRRVPDRFTTWVDRAFDYGQPAVRDYHLRLIRELVDRYDMDGLELDWMRFGFHFQPGHELAGGALLTEFTAEVRTLLADAAARWGHPIKLGARVPSRPETARRLGLDGAAWAKQGLLDWLTVTPFWASAETDMPIELWRMLLDGTGVTLAAGLEVLLRPHPHYNTMHTNSLETARGAAASFLDRGADRVYLFNYMDSETAIDDLHNYPTLLREIGEPDTLADKTRRHVVTFADTWATGEAEAYLLPAILTPGQSRAFRIPTGPVPEGMASTVVLGVSEGTRNLTVRINNTCCIPEGPVALSMPKPDFPLFAFIPPSVLPGENVVEVTAHEAVTLGWVEIQFTPA